jgi:hypothetical protein
MLKLGFLLVFFSCLAGCSASAIKQINEKAQEVIESRKIPDAQLTPEQLNQLKMPENARLLWLKAGVQADGNTFVCYVSVTPNQKTVFGQSQPDLVTLHAGIFEGSNTFKDLALPLIGNRDPLYAQHNNFQCLERGIVPPVKQVRSSEIRVQRKLEDIRSRRTPNAE